MSIFKNDYEKQELQEEKINKLLSKYELQNISKEYVNAIKNIHAELVGTDLIELGTFLSYNDKDVQRLHSYYLNTLIQQNWIIIRQLDNIANSLSPSISSKNTTNHNTIECQVCSKKIPYNEFGTCESCHKEILRRLEQKNK